MFLSSGFGPMADEANWERDSPPAVAGGDGEGRHGFVLTPRPIESEEGPPKRKEEPEVKPPENMRQRKTLGSIERNGRSSTSTFLVALMTTLRLLWKRNATKPDCWSRLRVWM